MANICSPANRSGDHSKHMTLHSVVDVKKCKLTPEVSDMHWKPYLASQKHTLEGNKNKIGSLEGFNVNVRNESKVKDTIKSCITAEVCEQVSTADLHPILDGNCDLNILQNSECFDNRTIGLY